jgi:hypothetical protein
MSIVELGAIGEFISSVIMLITLIYLVQQVRHLKVQAAMQATFNRGQGGRDVLLGIANSDYLPQITEKLRVARDPDMMSEAARGLTEHYGLTVEESNRMSMYWFAWLKNQETHFGYLSAPEQASVDRLMGNFLLQPGIEMWWPHSKEAFNADFSAHVEQVVAQRQAEMAEEGEPQPAS